MQRRKFSREFKLEAVKLVRERGVSSRADDETRARFEALDRAFDDACGPLFDALDEVVAVPITSLSDMHATAAYLTRVISGTCDHNGTIAALLASMGSGPVSSFGEGLDADPLAALVADYRRGLDAYNASPGV